MTLSTFKIDLISNEENNSKISLIYQNGYYQCADIVLFGFSQNNNKIAILDYEAEELVNLLKIWFQKRTNEQNYIWKWDDGTAIVTMSNSDLDSHLTFIDNGDSNNNVKITLEDWKKFVEMFETYSAKYK